MYYPLPRCSAETDDLEEPRPDDMEVSEVILETLRVHCHQIQDLSDVVCQEVGKCWLPR